MRAVMASPRFIKIRCSWFSSGPTWLRMGFPITAKNGRKMGRNEAETLALDALNWLVSDPELVGVFLGSSGLSSAELRSRATDPELLAAVLDFVLMDDDWVRRFTDANGHPATAPLNARQALPGGDLPNWT